MSLIQPAAITAIAHSVDVPGLTDEAAAALAPDVEYRLREVIQEALKFAKHAKRTLLTAEDVKQALRLRNVDPLYGFCSPDPARYLRVSGHPELFYVKDPDLSYSQLIDAPLPLPPREMGLTMHWLVVGGVQPRIPQNEPLAQEHGLQPARKKPRLGKETARPAAGGAAPAGAPSGAAGGAPTPRASDTGGAAGAGAAGGAAGAGPSAGAGAGGSGAPGGAAGAGAGVISLPLPAGVPVGPGAVAAAAVAVQAPVRHLVPKELFVYFDKVVGLLTSHPPPPTAAPATAMEPAAAVADDDGAAVGARAVPAAAAAAAAAIDGAGPGLGLGGQEGTEAGGGPSSQAQQQQQQQHRVRFADQPDGPAAPEGRPAAAAAAAAADAGGFGRARRQPAPPLPAVSGAQRQAALVRAALSSVATDPGLHPLTPYFVSFIAQGVRTYRSDLEVLQRLLRLARALISNPELNLGPYLKQLLPAVMTALLTSPLGATPWDPHWEVRDAAASVVALICHRFSAPCHNVVTQVCRVLTGAWLDPTKGLDTKLGAVAGLAALGPAAVRSLLLPVLEPQRSQLLPAAIREPGCSGGICGQQQQQQQQQQWQRDADAWQLHRVLQGAVGTAMHDRVLGHVRSRLPPVLLMQRPRHGNAVDWDDAERAAAAQLAADAAGAAAASAAERPLRVSLAVEQQQQQQQAAGGGGAGGPRVVLRIQELASAAAAAHAAALQRARAAAASLDDRREGRRAAGPGAGAAASGTPDDAMDVDHPPQQPARRARRPGRASGSSGGAAARPPPAARDRGGAAEEDGEGGDDLPALARVLARAGADDSDMRETLDALSHLFGEGLLPFMPLYQLPMVSL